MRTGTSSGFLPGQQRRGTFRNLSILLVLLFTFAKSEHVQAQGVRVFVTHYPAPITRSVGDGATHERPGVTVGSRIDGFPSAVDLLEVAPNESVCYIVHGANPLLYSYGMTAVDVPVAPPGDLAELVKQLQALVPSKAGLLDATPTPEKYRNEVRAIVDLLPEIPKLRDQSDRNATFKNTVAAFAGLWKDIDDADKRARATYANVSDKSAMATDSLVHRLVMREVELARKTVAAAAALMEPGDETLRTCKPMLSGRTRFGLTIQIRGDAAAEKPARIVSKDKESLAQFVLDPKYTERFRFAPGVFVAGLFSADRDVGVTNGAIQISETGRTYARTGMFAMARWTDHVWPTLGVAKGDGSLVDLFGGFQVRAGNLLSGPEISIGFGVAWMDVPVGAGTLQNGATLPDKKKLEDVITRDRQMGFGFTFTISGLTFGKQKAEGDGSK